MLHDLIVHRFDAEPDGDLAADVATDGVSDFLLALTVIGRRLPRDGRRLLFAADDTGGRWHVTLAPDGLDWREGDGPADVTVSAPVRDLLLSLNRRRDPAVVTGDRELYATWWEATAW
jgi:predicted lipid carrier protein YhbT